jgi:hypothetical protein
MNLFAPVVTSHKPVLPTLWIDTLAVIDLTKLERGEPLSDIRKERGNRLGRLVTKLVGAGKMLCPQSDQDEEYVVGSFDREVHGMFASLSLGIHLTHREDIFDEHVFKGMKAYAEKADRIELPSSTYFYEDPVRHLEKQRKESFVISVGPLKSPEILKGRAEAKEQIGREWEALRQRYVGEGQTYEQQLKLEQLGHAEGMLEIVRKFEMNLVKGHLNSWDLIGANGPYLYRTYWNRLGAQPLGWDGVYSFFCSPYFTELPLPYVGCRLGADLLTGPARIVPSDSMDVELLSVAIPVSHYVLTDRRMEQRIKRLGLDATWGTKVYSMSSIEDLFSELEKLA